MQRRNITGNLTFSLGDPEGEKVGGFIVSIKGTGWTGSVKPQARMAVHGPDFTAHAFADQGYMNAVTHAKVAAGTTQTGDFVFDIPAVGQEVQLVTTTAAGSVEVFWAPYTDAPITPWS